MRYATVAAVIALSLIAGPSARADSVLPEDAEPGFWLVSVEEGGSWKAGFVYKPDYLWGVEAFNFRITPLEGAPNDQSFDDPGFSKAGWSVTIFNDALGKPTVLTSSGPLTNCNHQQFTIYFEIGKFPDYSLPNPWINSPPFVIQLQAYGRQYNPWAPGGYWVSDTQVRMHNQAFYFDGTKWQQSGAYDSYPGSGSASGAYQYLDVPAWTVNAPLPEPVTMVGMLIGVGGLVRYVRRRRAA